MKKKDKIILTIIVIVSLLVTWITNAQERKISALIGYKSVDVGFTYLDEETELIYGVSVSAVDSKVSEKRANRNDKGKIHDFYGDLVPAAWGLVGAKFDNLSIIGKIGGSYVNQIINGKSDPQKAYLAFGFMVDYQISDTIGLRGSYDSVNSAMIGLLFKI